MVAKINVGSSLFGALAYNQNKVDEEQGKVLLSNKMFESPDGKFDIYKCMDCFNMQMPLDIRTKKPIIHISLNPHPDDVLTDGQLTDIAKEYMDKLGYGNQPYMVFKHEDIDRHHLHIVSLRVDETGKKLNDKFEYRKSKAITKELEEKYGLHPADRKQQRTDYEIKKIDYRAGDVKKQLSNTVRGLAAAYQFQSFNEFKTLLSLYNIHAEEVKGEHNGQPYNGIVYSATNDKGEKKGNPIKSSRLSKAVGYDALQRRMKRAGQTYKDGKLKSTVRATVTNALNQSKNRKQFTEKLKEKGINVLFRQNTDGRIYGVTFIDHENRAVLNGSRLGKEFSANTFNTLFGAEQPEPTFSQEQFKDEHSQSSGVESAIGGILSLLPDADLSSGNEQIPLPSEEERRRKKRKRRRIT